MSRRQTTVASQPPEAFEATTPVPVAPGQVSNRVITVAKTLPPGTRIGRYLVTEPLGHGGMGVIYAARDPDLGREVAIKLLRSDNDDPDATQRITREAKAMARTPHPNVVAVFDVGTFDGQVFIAMERVSGTDLRKWLDERPRTTAEILEVFTGAGLGLAAAHDAGLIHGDFKPDNVLVSVEGRAKVTDFGLADDDETHLVTSDSERTVRPLAGTPSYMAPEQHAGGHVDARSDQFSFAVALHEALYGKRPFAGDTYKQLADAIIAGKIAPPPPSSRVPASLRAIILKALSVKPGGRYPTMAELLRALGRDRGRRPRQIGRAAAVAFALVAVAFGADWAMRDRTRRDTRTSFESARTQLDRLMQLRTEVFTGQSEALYAVPVMQEVVASRDMADFGLGDESEDRDRLVKIHETLRSASWVELTRTHKSDVIAIADHKGRLLFDSATGRWDTTITSVPAIAAAYSAGDTSIGVIDGADPKVASTGLLVGSERKLYVAFARAKRIGPQPRSLFVQLFEATQLLGDVGVGETTFLSVVTAEGVAVGTVPADVIEKPTGTGTGIEEVTDDADRPWLVERAPLRARGQPTAIAQIVLARTADVGLAGLFPQARLALGALLVMFASLTLGGLGLARLRDLSR